MKVHGYLFISHAGNLRINKTGAGLKANEIAVEVNLVVPDSFFRRPRPVVSIELEEPVYPEGSLEATLRVTAETVADALQLDIGKVSDGLTQMLQSHEDGET